MKLFHPPIAPHTKKVNILIGGKVFCVQVEKINPSLDLSMEDDLDDRKYLKNPPVWAPFKYDGNIPTDKESTFKHIFIYNAQDEMWKLLDAKIDNISKEITFNKCILLSD